MPEASKEGQRWVSQGKRDLDDAHYLLQGKRYNTACFMAHQSAEKAVAGYLYQRGAEEVWGHSLSDLCEDAAMFDQTFQILRASASILDKYFYLTRYPRYLPGGIPSDSFDEAEARRATHLAREVLDFVDERMKT